MKKLILLSVLLFAISCTPKVEQEIIEEEIIEEEIVVTDTTVVEITEIAEVVE